MNKSLIIIGWLIFSSLAQSQNTPSTHIPDSIKSEFRKLYPTENPVWDKLRNSYRAKFNDVNGVIHVLVYDKNGKLLRKEERLKSAIDAPQTITEYYHRHFPADKEFSVWRLEKGNEPDSYFIERSGEVLYFDSRGNYLRKEKKEAE